MNDSLHGVSLQHGCVIPVRFRFIRSASGTHKFSFTFYLHSLPAMTLGLLVNHEDIHFETSRLYMYAFPHFMRLSHTFVSVLRSRNWEEPAFDV